MHITNILPVVSDDFSKNVNTILSYFKVHKLNTVSLNTCSGVIFFVCSVSILLLNINLCLDWLVNICLAVISFLGGETLNFSKYLKAFSSVLFKFRD